MRIKLTDLTIQNFKHQLPQVTYWDTLLPAFGVRVGARSKTFIVMQGKSRKRQTIGRYPSLKLAEARKRASRVLGDPSVHQDVAVADAVAEYLNAIETRPRTHKDYTRLLSRHLTPALGRRPLVSVTARDILLITDKLLHTPAECRHAHVAMQTFFNWCVPRHMTVSPVTGLRTPTKPTARDRVLTTTELKAIWSASHQLAHFGTVVRLCILTGQRRGEVSSLQPTWIHGDVLTIPATVAKNKREHKIPLTPQALALSLQAPFKVGNWGRKKNELDQISGVTNWVLHDLRRTFSTMLAELQVAPHAIEKILNHVSGKDALSPLAAIYNRASYLSEMREALNRYEAHLSETVICRQIVAV